MPRNPNGTPERRALFATVDDLNAASDNRLVSDDGLYLTERGRKTQRNYENWQARKLVPTVSRNSAPKPIDAVYVARFFRLTDGQWLPNSATVLHIFAEGIPCPPEVLREAMRSLPLQIQVAVRGELDAISLDDLVESVEALIQEKGHGNGKKWRESPDGTRARNIKKALATGKTAPSVNAHLLDDPVPGPSSLPTLAYLLAPFLSHYAGPVNASDLYDLAEQPFEGLDYSAMFVASEIGWPTFSPEELPKNRAFLLELAAIFGPALDRLRDDPESIVPKIKQRRPLLLLGARVFAEPARQLGIRTSSKGPRYLEFLDTIIILWAAIDTERERNK